MVRNGVVINATEPAPFGIADDLLVSGLVAPAHQAAHHTRAQRHFDGCGRAPIPGGLRGRQQEIVGDAQDQFGIVQQTVHLHQLGVKVKLERNPCEKPFVTRICYNQHRASCRFE
jgi:hypothetical protein